MMNYRLFIRENTQREATTKTEKIMQGFSESLKARYKNKWAKSVTGAGSRRSGLDEKSRVITHESEKRLKGLKRRRKGLAVRR